MSKFVPTQVVQNKSTANSQGQFDHRLTSYFSRGQLALAVTIQKFKPKNLRTFGRSLEDGKNLNSNLA